MTYKISIRPSVRGGESGFSWSVFDDANNGHEYIDNYPHPDVDSAKAAAEGFADRLAQATSYTYVPPNEGTVQ